MANKENLDWETFEQKLKELRAKYASATSPLLFRGQANSDWPLTTTLERNGAGGMLFSDYYQLTCARMGPEVQTFAGVEVPKYDRRAAQHDFSNRQLLWVPGSFPEISLYRYMAYLRHLGFPSPLLDWSRSPFVAAFFAFRDDPPSGRPEKRRIYAYCEMPEGSKGGALGGPTIYPIGPYVQTHHRHFRQRCDYTICGQFDVAADQWRFHSHQDVFDHAYPNQDHLWEFDLRSTERDKILRTLNDYNLNAFSLFGSEESLLETMWFREYGLRKDAYS